VAWQCSSVVLVQAPLRRCCGACIAAAEEPSSPSASADSDSDDAGGGVAGGAFAVLEDADEDEWQTVPVKTAAPAKAAPIKEEEAPPEPAEVGPIHTDGPAAPAAQPARVLEVSRGASGDRGRGRGAARFGGARGGRGGRDGRAAYGGRSNGAVYVSDSTGGEGANASAARGRGPHGRGGRDRGGRGGRGRGQRGDRELHQDQQAPVVAAADFPAEPAANPAPAPEANSAGIVAPGVAASASGSLERYQSSFAALADAAQRFAGAGGTDGGRGRGRGRRGTAGGRRGGGREGYREQQPGGQDAAGADRRGSPGAGDGGHSTVKGAAMTLDVHVSMSCQPSPMAWTI